MTQLEYCMYLSAINGSDNEIDQSGRNLDLNQCPRYMPYTLRGYMNHRRRYLLPDGDSTVSDDVTRVPTGVFAGYSRIFSLDYLRSVYPFGGSVMSSLLRLRVPQDMTLIDRIHLAEMVILDVHNAIGTTSASIDQAETESKRDLSFNYHGYPNPHINGPIGGSYFQSIGYLEQLTGNNSRSGC
jgi:hypothetical protein